MSGWRSLWTKIVILYIVFALVNSQSDEEDTVTEEDSVSLNSIVEGSSKFAKKTYFLLRDLKPNGDFVSSPYSLTVLLGMLRSGANENRKAEIQEALQMQELSENTMTEGFSALRQDFPEIDEVEYKSLERIYVPVSYKIRTKYKESLQENYQAPTGIRSMDFSRSVTAAEKINEWVSQSTKGKLKSIISPDAIFKDTKLVLISAVYFRGSWENTFRIQTPENGTLNIFYLNDTHATEATMMYQHGQFKYANLPEMKSEVVAIPFASERLEFVILLPKSKEGLKYPLEQKLKVTNTTFGSIYSKMQLRNVKLTIPKFDVDSFSTFTHSDKNSMINKIGISVDPTRRSLLDYNGITPYPGLYIDKIILKTMISVTEKGSQPPQETPEQGTPVLKPISVNAEHPFIFYVYDTETKVILLQGRKLI